jgi:hypothetical protein
MLAIEFSGYMSQVAGRGLSKEQLILLIKDKLLSKGINPEQVCECLMDYRTERICCYFRGNLENYQLKKVASDKLDKEIYEAIRGQSSNATSTNWSTCESGDVLTAEKFDEMIKNFNDEWNNPEKQKERMLQSIYQHYVMGFGAWMLYENDVPCEVRGAAMNVMRSAGMFGAPAVISLKEHDLLAPWFEKYQELHPLD